MTFSVDEDIPEPVIFTHQGPVSFSMAPQLFRGELKVNNAVEHPSHYTNHPSGVECLDVTEHMNFNLGNVVKYVWRCDEKGNALEDLKKARFYLDREIRRRSRILATASSETQG